MQLDYFTEAGLWAEWLQTEHPDATTVAAVTFNNDFGKSYVDGFERRIEGTDIEVVDQQFHEPTAPDLTNQFTTHGRHRTPTSCCIETSGAFCTQAMAELEKNTTWNPIVIMSATCGSLSQFFQPLVDQGLTGEGTHIIQYVKDVNDAAFADDEFVQLFHETVNGAGPRRHADDVRHRLDLRLVHGGDPASRRPRTRAVSTAATSCWRPATSTSRTRWCSTASRSRPPASTDAYLIEGGQMAVYEVADPAQLGTFVPAGDCIDNNGGDRQLRRLPRGRRRLTARPRFRSE